MDCDHDTVFLEIVPAGLACHTRVANSLRSKAKRWRLPGIRSEELVSEQPALRIEAEPIDQAEAILKGLGHVVERTGDNQLIAQTQRERAPEIVTALSAAGIRVYQIVSERESLEQVFLRITRNEASKP